MLKYLAGPEIPILVLAGAGAISLALLAPCPMNIILSVGIAILVIWAIVGALRARSRTEEFQERTEEFQKTLIPRMVEAIEPKLMEAMQQARIPREQQEKVREIIRAVGHVKLPALRAKGAGTVRGPDQQGPQSSKDDS